MSDTIVTGIREFLNLGAQLELLSDTPIPILVIGWPGGWSDDALEDGLSALEWYFFGLPRENIGPQYKRCVELDRLDDILENGMDVLPTDSPSWAAQLLYKPLEYGGDEKIMLFFDPLCLKLDSTFHEFVIQGDPWTALKGIFVMGADHQRLCQIVNDALSRSTKPQWALKGRERIINI